MERYLNPTQVLRYPIGQKYKKTTYGGAKVFIKQHFINQQGKKKTLEFMLRQNRWQISPENAQTISQLNIDRSSIKKYVQYLNKTQIKQPIKLSINESEYKKLYYSYPDADRFGYYKRSSPEYVRVTDILKNVAVNSIVYDAGCNSGGIGKLLIKYKKCQVFGSEICPKLAKVAKTRGISVFCGWAEKTPFFSNYFDYVILTFILEHVISPKDLIQEVVRLLKPGGKVIGHVPTEYGDWGKKTIGKHPEHLRAFSKEELRGLLEYFHLRSVIITKRRLVGRHIADYYFFKSKK